MTFEKLRALSNSFLDTIEMYHSGIRDGVEHDSPFMADLTRVRRGMSPYEQGSALLSNSLDAAHTLATLWGDGAMHSPTDYALMRVMIDNALRAVWLTSPQHSESRLHRAWRLACDSPLRAKRTAEHALKRELEPLDRSMYLRTAAETKALITEIDQTFLGAGVDVVGPRAPVEMAEVFLDKDLAPWIAELHLRRYWSLLSSMVHGDLTPVAKFSLSEVDPADDRITLHNPDPTMLASTGATANMIVVSAVYGYLQKMSGDPKRNQLNTYSLSGIEAGLDL